MKTLLAAAAFLLLSTAADAAHTQCTALKELDRLNRPDGDQAVRGSTAIEKGERVAFLDSHGDWWFVWSANKEWAAGWVPRNALGSCRKVEGTP